MVLPLDKDLNQKLISCPYCNYTNQSNYIFLQSNPEVRMVKCGNCKLAYADRLPKETFLNELYDPKIYESNLTSDTKNTNKLAKKIFNKFNLKKDIISILDYGGGNGNLSHELIKLFLTKNIEAKSLVVDVHDSCKHQNIKFIHLEKFKNNTEKFDIILASAVLEHLPDFISVTNELLDKVKVNGFFYCRTPWEYEISKVFKFNKIKWPRHLYDIGGDYWTKFFEKKEDYKMILNETSSTEIKKKQFIKYVLAQLLKKISNIETAIFKNYKFYKPKWSFVGGWEVIVKKNA